MIAYVLKGDSINGYYQLQDKSNFINLNTVFVNPQIYNKI